MIEIEPKTQTEHINSSEAVHDSGPNVVEVPQEMLDHFNIKPEDDITMEDRYRLQEIFLTSKSLFPDGNLGAIMRFISAVESANPSYGASETDRLFNTYKNFKLGRQYG